MLHAGVGKIFVAPETWPLGIGQRPQKVVLLFRRQRAEILFEQALALTVNVSQAGQKFLLGLRRFTRHYQVQIAIDQGLFCSWRIRGRNDYVAERDQSFVLGFT